MSNKHKHSASVENVYANIFGVPQRCCFGPL